MKNCVMPTNSASSTILRRRADEHDDEEQGRVHDVPGADDAHGAAAHRDREHPEGDVLCSHGGRPARYFLPVSAPTSSGSGSGTVSIHSPSFSLSWRRSAMLY